MSNFLQAAKSDKPLLLLGSGSITDQSGNAYTLSNNNLQLTGQPIIYGNPDSFYVDATHGVEITSNPVMFAEDRSLEMVVVFNRPAEEFCMLRDADNNGLYVDRRGLTFRFGSGTELMFDLFAPIDDWNAKHYVVLNFASSSVSLTVDDFSASLSHSMSQTTGSIYLQAEDEESYLLDGFGIYLSRTSKKNMMNDPGTGHEQYSMSKNGHTTFLDNPYFFRTTYRISDVDFDEDHNQYFINFGIEQEGDSLVHVKTNYGEALSYELDFLEQEPFEKEIVIDASDKALLRVSFPTKPADGFFMHIDSIYNKTIDRDTPAVIQYTDFLYKDARTDFSLVNCYTGNRLKGSVLTGTSIIDSASVFEMIVKPIDLSAEHILLSQDGMNVSFGLTGSISGAVVYLNGVSVSDLSAMKVKQWNHVVIIPDAPTQTFVINETGLEFDLLGLAIYDSELDPETIDTLYEIASGTSNLSVSDAAFSVSDNNEALIYSYNWSIVSAGGR